MRGGEEGLKSRINYSEKITEKPKISPTEQKKHDTFRK